MEAHDIRQAQLQSIFLASEAQRASGKRAPRGQGTKGKRVHLCQAVVNGDLCGKTYSRAEHLRRHRYRVHQLSDTGSRQASYSLSEEEQSVEPSPADEEALQSPDLTLIKETNLESGRSTITFKDVEPKSHEDTPKFTPSRHFNLDINGEADLMYFWTHHYYVLEAGEYRLFRPTKEWWIELIPNLCTRNDSIRDLVLGVATSHMAMQHYVPSSQKLISARVYEVAVEQHQRDIRDLTLDAESWNTERLDALLTISYLLAIRAILVMREHEGVPSSEELVSLVFQELLLRQQLRSGVINLANTLCPRIVNSTFWQHVIIPTEEYQASEERCADKALPLPPATRSPKFFSILYTSDEGEDQLSKDSFETMLYLLEWVYHAVIEDCPDRALQARWRRMQTDIPQHFLDLLCARHPKAMAIFAYCICLQKAPGIANIWLISEDVAPTVKALADLAPRDWAWAFEWPIAIALGNGNVKCPPPPFTGSGLPHASRSSLWFPAPIR